MSTFKAFFGHVLKRLLVGCVSLFVVLALPAAGQEVSCGYPEKPMLDIDLMFGRNVDSVLGVTEESWDDFVTREITPRFPGFTVVDAVGYWEGAQELSKRVLISVDARCEEAAQTKVDDIVEAYRQRFQQESVGVVIDRVCVSFCRPRSSCKSQEEPPNC